MQGKKQNLALLRKEIDKIDSEISKFLKKRRDIVHKINEIKKNENLPTIDEKREQEILEKFDSEYEKNIFKTIIRESRSLK